MADLPDESEGIRAALQDLRSLYGIAFEEEAVLYQALGLIANVHGIPLDRISDETKLRAIATLKKTRLKQHGFLELD